MVKQIPLLRIIILSIAGIFVLAVALFWGVAMPIRNLPDPTGPLTVGTVVYDLVQSARPDPYAELVGDPPGPRTIRLQIWYPALEKPRAARPMRWMPDGLKQVQGIVETHGFPKFIWNHTAYMRSNSYDSATPLPPSNVGLEKWPVVLISHGWLGYRGLHADVAEELASHGYVVAIPDHSYGAAVTLLDDGRLLKSDTKILPVRTTVPNFEDYASALVQTFADDNKFILEHLSLIQSGISVQAPEILSELQGKLDLERIGIAGHSTGGGAMVRWIIDRFNDESTGSSIVSFVGLDAWVEPVGEEDLYSGAFNIPSLFLRSEPWEGGVNDEYLLPFIETIQAPVELYQIEAITHAQFSTSYMYAPAIQWFGMIGETDPWEFRDYQREHILRFFDSTIKGKAYIVPDYNRLESRLP
jgi:hypothetical protein